MPKLKCKADNCAYNYDWLCGKNYIDVDGPTAKCKSDTLCRSYQCKEKENDKYGDMNPKSMMRNAQSSMPKMSGYSMPKMPSMPSFGH